VFGGADREVQVGLVLPSTAAGTWPTPGAQRLGLTGVRWPVGVEGERGKIVQIPPFGTPSRPLGRADRGACDQRKPRHADAALFGRRIEISQRDEIAWMTRWLERRGETAPMMGAGHAHGLGEGELMPGMLSREEMAALAAARGSEFDRLFLEGMIKHHQGALMMVAELFDSPGGGQETEIFRFAADVDADQDMEILRMSDMLNAIQ